MSLWIYKDAACVSTSGVRWRTLQVVLKVRDNVWYIIVPAGKAVAVVFPTNAGGITGIADREESALRQVERTLALAADNEHYGLVPGMFADALGCIIGKNLISQ